MAKRKQLYHSDEIKEKIRMSQLMKRLQDNALADKEFLTAGQIRSIESLLDRVVPRLKSVEHSGNADNPIHAVTKVVLVPFGSDESSD